jgi:ABC-type multidrug transport system permease subunit
LNIDNKIDIIKARVDILHKKILVLLGATAGSFVYSLEFLKSDQIITIFIGVLIFFAFIFFIVGLALSFFKLAKFDSMLERLYDELE